MQYQFIHDIQAQAQQLEKTHDQWIFYHTLQLTYRQSQTESDRLLFADGQFALILL